MSSICMSLISGAETFSLLTGPLDFPSCELPLCPWPVLLLGCLSFLLICGSFSSGSVAIFCQLVAYLFTLFMESFDVQGFYI